MATALTALAPPVAAWFLAVNATVKNPYLDEIFHVRQAQHYCAGHFGIWDPKITTPPGVYILSYILSPFVGCDIVFLRASSALWLVLTLVLAYISLRQRAPSGTSSTVLEHITLNLTLFPVLFFFSALYYTDVASTLSVLLCYILYTWSRQSKSGSWISRVALFITGLVSLTFRQTNIFWVAVFPAALTLISELDRGHRVIHDSMHRKEPGFGDTVLSVAKTSWKLEVIYDPPVQDSGIEEYFRTVISICTYAIKTAFQPMRVFALILALSPYIALVASFALFVFLNGGVVLGDRSNHVATLHLPQMLYLWPYLVFFSWPLLLDHILIAPLSLLVDLAPRGLRDSMPMKLRRSSQVPSLWLLIVFVGAASVCVRYNTIIHPFTLADNRHYTFYVFRLLMRPWWVRYTVTPFYILSGWACIQALGTPSISSEKETRPSFSNTHRQNPASRSRVKDHAQPITVSFVLIWLGTSALQLITAPLVEPRYFILPWLFWRLHLPFERRPAWEPGLRQGRRENLSLVEKVGAFVLSQPLWMETAWLLFVNVTTGYVFLKWDFVWPQNPGEAQRFMW